MSSSSSSSRSRSDKSEELSWSALWFISSLVGGVRAVGCFATGMLVMDSSCGGGDKAAGSIVAGVPAASMVEAQREIGLSARSVESAGSRRRPWTIGKKGPLSGLHS